MPMIKFKKNIQENIAVGSLVTILWETELFDNSDSFASNIFTTPALWAGKYQFCVNVTLNSIPADCTFVYIILITSAGADYYAFYYTGGVAITGESLTINILAPMAAGETAYVAAYQTGGTQQTDISTYSSFSGFFVTA